MEEEPSKFTPCSICARESYTVRGREVQLPLHTVSVSIKVDDRSVIIKEQPMCHECVAQLPNFISGSLHLALNIPKEKFNRSFKLPPCSLVLEKEKAQRKSSQSRHKNV